MAPSYTFATPVLGGQATAYLLGLYGSNSTSLDGTLSGTLGPIPFSRSFALQQNDIVFGDLIPIFTLRWNAGVNNYMTYLAGDIPVGKYDSTSIDNLGLGHGALDGGVGYTYFDEKTGHEFSAVLGLTGNFQNPSTGSTSGIDSHLDWGASQFLTKQLQVGLVGYFYEQLTRRQWLRPAAMTLRIPRYRCRPQFGYIFPVGNMQGYVNLKAYGEFANNDRPDGWNAWLTFVLSPAQRQHRTSLRHPQC